VRGKVILPTTGLVLNAQLNETAPSMSTGDRPFLPQPRADMMMHASDSTKIFGSESARDLRLIRDRPEIQTQPDEAHLDH
jgi:hypothetical protein